MPRGFRLVVGAVALGTAAVLALPIASPPSRAAAAAGQAGASSGTRPVPRTADGKPDLSGVWIATFAVRLLYGEDEFAAIQAADARIGRPDPPREPLPYRPEYDAQRQRYVERRGIDDPMARCLISGVPRITARPLPFQIVQTPDLMVFLYEVHHAFRIIPTDGRPHPDDWEPSYLGESIGRWEGDTFVVDVIGFNTDTWLSGVGTVHSDQMRVTERYTRDTYDTIRYEVTVEDPVVFTKPWHTGDTLRLRPGERLREYECIENNNQVLERIERLMEAGVGGATQ